MLEFEVTIRVTPKADQFGGMAWTDTIRTEALSMPEAVRRGSSWCGGRMFDERIEKAEVVAVRRGDE